MIAAWMLYSTAFGILIAAAALLTEQLADRNGLPTRRVWALGLAGAVILPVYGMLMKDGPAAVELDGAVQAVSPLSGVMMQSVDVLAALDTGLVVLWVLASAVLATLLVAGMLTSWRRCRAWTHASVDGVPVLVADDVGPAVIGFLNSRIVLPRWALGADRTERQMMLRHEEEHLAARDPRLVLFSALVLVLLPWNLAAWYMAHRLRLAIEVDCDRRVVRSSDLDMRGYAELLLSVGMRRSVGAYGIGFSLGRPFLEQRIDRMTLPKGRARLSTNLAGVVAVVGVLGAGWALPQPVRAANVGLGWGDVSCPADGMETNRTLLNAHQRST